MSQGDDLRLYVGRWRAICARVDADSARNSAGDYEDGTIGIWSRRTDDQRRSGSGYGSFLSGWHHWSRWVLSISGMFRLVNRPPPLSIEVFVPLTTVCYLPIMASEIRLHVSRDCLMFQGGQNVSPVSRAHHGSFHTHWHRPHDHSIVYTWAGGERVVQKLMQILGLSAREIVKLARGPMA